MQAVIMAGGKGTRLASVTKDIPKPMVSIAGKPLLESQIENLRECGVKHIILVVGYLGNVIKDYFQDGKRFGVEISYYVEETPLGTAGALRELYDRLEDQFFLVFGDLFLNVDFLRFAAFHASKNALMTLFAHPNSHPYDSDIVVTDKHDCVTAWSYKNSIRTEDYDNLVNAGLYVVNRELVKTLPLHQKTDLEKDVITQQLGTHRIFAYRSTEYVKDIGTPERLKKVTADYENGVCAHRNLQNKQKVIFLDRDGTINQYVGFLRTADQVKLEPTAAEAIRLINESEYLAIVITNQPVIARGECTYEELDKIHKRLYTLLGQEGAYVDGLYYCPHHPDAGFPGEISSLKIDCDCRKPKIGMLKAAERDFHIDLSESWLIGDTGVDVQTGINGGMHTILLETGDSRKRDKYDAEPEITCRDLLAAVQYILKR